MPNEKDERDGASSPAVERSVAETNEESAARALTQKPTSDTVTTKEPPPAAPLSGETEAEARNRTAPPAPPAPKSST
jgi:hypothetical protein